MPESNQIKWFGIRPTNPAENIPVQQTDPALLKATVSQVSNIREVYPKQKSGTTQISVFGYALNAIATVYTVTAGKTLYVCSFIFSIKATTAGSAQCYITNPGDGGIIELFYVDRPAGEGLAFPMNFNPPLALSAGWKIKAVSAGTGLYSWVYIYGWEE